MADTEPNGEGGGLDTAAVAREVHRTWSVQSVLVPLYSVLLALAVASVIILLVGGNPLEAYAALLDGMFGTPDRISASLGRSTPFIGASLAVAFAFRAGLFNIGAEGQLLVGATAAAWVGTFSWIADVPAPLALLLVTLAGVLGGGFWGFIPGALKAKTGAHEVITTIMLNSIAVLFVRWMVTSQDPVILRDLGASVPRTEPSRSRPGCPRSSTRNRLSTSGSSSPCSCACWCGSSCAAPPSASRSARSAPTRTPLATPEWASTARSSW